MVYRVDFISLECDEKDIVVSFAIPSDELGVISLVLYRTLFFEEFLPDNERGVKVSLEGDEIQEDTLNMLESIKISGHKIEINTSYRTYIMDVSKIDSADIAEMALLIEKQNYDGRFKVENA